MRRTAVSSDAHDVAHLDAPEKLARQKSEWRCERGGWVAMALVLAAAAAGLLGPGLTGKQSAISSSGAAACEYEGWIRCESPTELRVLRPEASAGPSTVRLTLPRKLLARVTIDEVLPRASHEVAAEENLVYLLQVRGDAPIVVRFKAHQPGRVAFDLGVDDEHVPIRQIVLP